MSTHPTEPEPGGHFELPVDEQVARARPWAPADEQVLDDLTDVEEADFLAAIAR